MKSSSIKLDCFEKLAAASADTDNQWRQEINEFWNDLGKTNKNTPKDIAVVIWGDYHIPQLWGLDDPEELRAFLAFQKNPGKSEVVGRYYRDGDTEALFQNVAEDIEFVMERRLEQTSRFQPHKVPVPQDYTWLEYHSAHSTYRHDVYFRTPA